MYTLVVFNSSSLFSLSTHPDHWERMMQQRRFFERLLCLPLCLFIVSCVTGTATLDGGIEEWWRWGKRVRLI